jgi:hypothetical protein
MTHRFPPLRPALLLQIARVSAWLQERYERARTTPERDRGANVVETIVIVAGFAAIAAFVYTAVRGKVTGWISKIP